jgi:hypothetical protein
MLTLGWSDGNTFLPWAFSLLSSEKESSRLYICCNELKDISLAEALQKLLSLLEQFLGERLQLAEQEIRVLLEYLIGNLPSFFKEWLAVCCCESCVSKKPFLSTCSA